MTLKINKALALATILASVAFSGANAQDTRDVVIDSSGNKVVNTFGNCVRTRWDAGVDKCAAQQVAQATSAKEPTEKSRSYLVFFDFDKSNLTEDAKDILNTVFADAEHKHASTFEVTGHADRAGSDAYNIALSSRRAETVKRQLMAMGADEQIHTDAKGESVPLVPTADGVREPQNRRVEIVFGYRE
jgi:outer membrane protein OmpA-like peptidoglycan-associated protein